MNNVYELGLNLFKQSNVFTPYASSGEVNYMNGIAFHQQLKSIEYNLFYSRRKLDANTEVLNDVSYIKSFKIDGLHQTDQDLLKRNSITHQLIGINMQHHFKNGNIQATYLNHKFSSPFL